MPSAVILPLRMVNAQMSLVCQLAYLVHTHIRVLGGHYILLLFQLEAVAVHVSIPICCACVHSHLLYMYPFPFAVHASFPFSPGSTQSWSSPRTKWLLLSPS